MSMDPGQLEYLRLIAENMKLQLATVEEHLQNTQDENRKERLREEAAKLRAALENIRQECGGEIPTEPLVVPVKVQTAATDAATEVRSTVTELQEFTNQAVTLLNDKQKAEYERTTTLAQIINNLSDRVGELERQNLSLVQQINSAAAPTVKQMSAGLQSVSLEVEAEPEE